MAGDFLKFIKGEADWLQIRQERWPPIGSFSSSWDVYPVVPAVRFNGPHWSGVWSANLLVLCHNFNALCWPISVNPSPFLTINLFVFGHKICICMFFLLKYCCQKLNFITACSVCNLLHLGATKGILKNRIICVGRLFIYKLKSLVCGIGGLFCTVMLLNWLKIIYHENTP